MVEDEEDDDEDDDDDDKDDAEGKLLRSSRYMLPSF